MKRIRYTSKMASASRLSFVVAAASLALGTSGCTVGPFYTRPEIAVPAAWQSGAGAEADLETWWNVFRDPALSSLVERAVAANLDLRVAEARIREARALRRVAASSFWPSADAVGRYTRTERQDSNGGGFIDDGNAIGGGAVGGGGAIGGGGSGSSRSGDFFRASVDALWEIDLFGGVARSIEAADADLDAAAEARRGMLVRLLGDVAATYVEVRSLQAELGTTRANLDAQRETLGYTEARSDAGLASDLDVERARALVAGTTAEVPPLEASLRAAVHRLGVLLGAGPDLLVEELSAGAPIPIAPAAVAVGVPADLLRRRPDVRSAERALAAATARIGEAEADLYPRLTLIGSVGLRSEDIQDLVTGKSLISSFGPSVVWPIFDAGRIRANVDVQEARQEQAFARYELAIRRALEEVESASVRYAREHERQRALQEAAAANRVASELARELYANGLADFLVVLDAERSRLDAERLLGRSAAAVSTNLVALYVALGGGWETAENR